MTDAPPSATTPAPEPLVARYPVDTIGVFSSDDRERFLEPFGADAAAALKGDEHAWARIAPHLAWELLYRVEPELYERLIAGERVHPAVLDWLPARVDDALEVAAGGGRLTLDLAGRCTRLVAVEPAAPLRRLLERKLADRRIGNVDVRAGFFDAIPAPDASADLVITLSAFTSDPAHGAESGLTELERVAKPGALVVLVWPADTPWLTERGFAYVSFPGDMAVDFGSVEEAIALAAIFYPHALDEIKRIGSAVVGYQVLGLNPPRDLAWKRAA